MQKYFISTKNLNECIIDKDDAFHISTVMRNKIGDEIIVSDELKTYLAKIKSLSNNLVNFEVVEEIKTDNELPVKITIFQGYPKGDKLDDIIKHSTELGAYEFFLTIMKRSLFKLDLKKKEAKLERFQKIAKEAAEQSYRRIIPKVKDIVELKKINFDEYDKLILCYEESSKKGDLCNFKSIIKSLNKNEKVAVLIGPEGGIDESELKYLLNIGFIPCGLGPRILRTETAASYVLSSISYEMELK